MKTLIEKVKSLPKNITRTQFSELAEEVSSLTIEEWIDLSEENHPFISGIAKTLLGESEGAYRGLRLKAFVNGTSTFSKFARAVVNGDVRIGPSDAYGLQDVKIGIRHPNGEKGFLHGRHYHYSAKSFEGLTTGSGFLVDQDVPIDEMLKNLDNAKFTFALFKNNKDLLKWALK